MATQLVVTRVSAAVKPDKVDHATISLGSCVRNNDLSMRYPLSHTEMLVVLAANFPLNIHRLLARSACRPDPYTGLHGIDRCTLSVG